LSRISEVDNLPVSTPLPITADKTVLGHDPDQATIVLDDISIEASHARLTRQADGSYRLADEGTIAGTWINYSPVSQGGSRLEHGDLIHIGKVGFRFTLRNPTRVRKPVVISGTDNQEIPRD
jgi:predicted component of type VI protein secretion system